MRRTGAEWEEVLTKMIEKGATGTEKEFETVYGYLLRNFGKLNINAARPDEIAMVLGLSEKEAQAIVAYRKATARSRISTRSRKCPASTSRNSTSTRTPSRSERPATPRRSRLANGRLFHMLIASREGVDVMHAHARLIAAVVIAAGAMTGLGLAQGDRRRRTATRRTEPSADAPRRAGRRPRSARRWRGRAGGRAAAAAAASRSSLARSRRPTCWCAASRCTRPTAPAATRWTCAGPPTARIRTCCARARRSNDKQGELIAAAIAKHTPAITLVEADSVAVAEYIHSIHATMGGQGSPPGRNPTNVDVEHPRRRCRRRARPTSRPPARRVTR